MSKHDETSRKMIAFRTEFGIERSEMARRCGTPEGLIKAIEEEDWITHPHIAARVCAEYGLTVNDYNALVHKSHIAMKLPKPVPRPEMCGYSIPKSVFRQKSDEEIILDKEWL